MQRSGQSILMAFGLFLVLMQLPAHADDNGNEASLYERLGGLGPISVVVSDFIDVLVPDPQLNKNPAIDAARMRVPAPYLKYHVTAMVCDVTGGPCNYHGRGMKEAHAHLSITGEEWDRMVTLFLEVLDKHDVPEREKRELVKIIDSTREDIVTASAD